MEQTDSCQKGGVGGVGWKKVKELAKEHVCLTYEHRQCGDGHRERGKGFRGMGTFEIVSTIKIKKKRKKKNWMNKNEKI